MKAITPISICTILILILISGCAQVISDKEVWSYPVNYPEILDNAEKGDNQAQEEIAKLIYKGVMPYPQKKKRDDGTLFYWLIENDYNESFERKVARFFFTGGDWFDSKEILKEILIKAEQGDPYAQRVMGCCDCYTGSGEISFKEKKEWNLKAAKQGHAAAQLMLASIYFQGHDVEKNISEGIKWLKMASKSGLPRAQRVLGDFYYSGKIIKKDINLAYELYISAAKRGDIDSQYLLAMYHLDMTDLSYMTDLSFPIMKNKDKGLEWLAKASNNCDVDAMAYYGYCYLTGKHVPLNHLKGIEILKKAAYFGSKDAIEILDTTTRIK